MTDVVGIVRRSSTMHGLVSWRAEAVASTEYYFRATPYFETGAQKYAWLNKIVAVGAGQVELSKAWVGYKVYEVG